MPSDAPPGLPCAASSLRSRRTRRRFCALVALARCCAFAACRASPYAPCWHHLTATSIACHAATDAAFTGRYGPYGWVDDNGGPSFSLPAALHGCGTCRRAAQARPLRAFPRLPRRTLLTCYRTPGAGRHAVDTTGAGFLPLIVTNAFPAHGAADGTGSYCGKTNPNTTPPPFTARAALPDILGPVPHHLKPDGQQHRLLLLGQTWRAGTQAAWAVRVYPSRGPVTPDWRNLTSRRHLIRHAGAARLPAYLQDGFARGLALPNPACPANPPLYTGKVPRQRTCFTRWALHRSTLPLTIWCYRSAGVNAQLPALFSYLPPGGDGGSSPAARVRGTPLLALRGARLSLDACWTAPGRPRLPTHAFTPRRTIDLPARTPPEPGNLGPYHTYRGMQEDIFCCACTAAARAGTHQLWDAIRDTSDQDNIPF